MRPNHHTYRRIPGLALAAFTAATIAGCTLAPTPVVDEPAPTASPVDDAELPDQPEGTFGDDGVTYPDGLTVKLSVPETFDPSPSAFTEGDAPYYVRFTVSVVNDTDERFDPVLTSVSVASGETEGAMVYDVVNGLSSPPETDIAPGEARSWVVAFGVTDPADLTAEVSLNDLLHDAAMFELRAS